jgi:hypothetical protein
MQIQIVKSKIHRVKVTGADLNYIGSITIDETLLEASNIIEGEKVYIVNINNGERFKKGILLLLCRMPLWILKKPKLLNLGWFFLMSWTIL